MKNLESNKNLQTGIEAQSRAKTEVDVLKLELELSPELRTVLASLDNKKEAVATQHKKIDTYYAEKAKTAGSNDLTNTLTDTDQEFINEMYATLGELEESERAEGSKFWKYLESNPELRKEYLAFLEKKSDLNARHLPQNIALN